MQTFVMDIKHPSYVYSARFYPERFDYERLILLTACFDGKIRVYYLDISKDIIVEPELINENYLMIDNNRNDQELVDLRHPNTMKFNNKGTLFIGDSKGSIHLWEVRVTIFALRNSFSEQVQGHRSGQAEDHPRKRAIWRPY